MLSNVVLVCGSVEWIDPAPIQRRLMALPRGTVIRHGNSRGADKIAGAIARRLGLGEDPCDADWSVKDHTPPERIRRRHDGSTYDVGAGYERNDFMLDKEPVPFLVLAFQINRSGGTQHTIDGARARSIPVEVEHRWLTPSR